MLFILVNLIDMAANFDQLCSTQQMVSLSITIEYRV